MFKGRYSIILLCFGFILSIVCIYFFLFSIKLSNNFTFINIRKQYYSVVDKIRVSLKIPNSFIDNSTYLGVPIRVFGINKSDGEYIYGFIGKLKNISIEKQQITLGCCGSKEYIFNAQVSQSDSFTKVKITDLPSGEIVVDTDSSQYQVGIQLSIIWKDKRTLSEILSEHKANPFLPINRLVKPVLINATTINDK